MIEKLFSILRAKSYHKDIWKYSVIENDMALYLILFHLKCINKFAVMSKGKIRPNKA